MRASKGPSLLHCVASCITVCLLFLSAATKPRPPVPKVEPELFGEGVVSTGFDERDGALAPDGRSFYFTKSVRDNDDLMVIVFARYKDGGWQEPEVAPFSGRYRDKNPFISADGTKLYFSSDRPVTGTQPKTDFDIWVVEKKGQGWGKPRNLGPPINTAAEEQSPYLTAAGTLYFASDRPGGRGNSDIYLSKWAGGQFSTPENLGEAVNAEGAEMAVCAEQEGRFIIFSSSRKGGIGNLDLYISRHENGRWTTAQNLDFGINTGAVESSPSFSPDGRYLFFSSTRGMGQSGYQAERMTYSVLLKKIRGARNDSADIYRLPVSALPAPQTK